MTDTPEQLSLPEVVHKMAQVIALQETVDSQQDEINRLVRDQLNELQASIKDILERLKDK